MTALIAEIGDQKDSLGYNLTREAIHRRARMKRAELRMVRETRAWGLSNVEVREEADGTIKFSGYATVFDRDYVVRDSFGEYNERIAPGAFDRTLTENPDVVLVINHEGLPLARTKSGTLRLAPDSFGLRVESQLDGSDPDVQALLPKMRRGDVDEMSFAFRVNEQEWSPDYSERTITEVNLHRGDVSIVTFGANPHTLALLRAALADDSVRAQLIQQDPEAARVLTKSSMENVSPVAAEEPEPDLAPVDTDDIEPVDTDDADDVTDDEEELARFQLATMQRLLATKVSPAT